MKLPNQNKTLCWLIGSSLILIPMHWYSAPLATFGVMFSVIFSLMYIGFNYGRFQFGKPIVYIPMAIIAGSIGIAGILNGNAAPSISIGLSMFVFYLVGVNLKESVFKPFMVMVIIEAVSIIVITLTGFGGGARNGGIYSLTNYDMAAGILIFGFVVSAIKYQWWLSAVAVTGLLFLQAEEGLFALAVLVIAIIVRRDFSKKMLLPVGITAVLLVGVFGAIAYDVGPMKRAIIPLEGKAELAVDALITNGQVYRMVDNGKSYDIVPLNRGQILNILTGDRWLVHWRLNRPIQPFGYGYNMTNYYYGIPHNILLIIIDQVGILALLAWLFVVGYCLVKTKYKYAFIAVLALGVFDHYIWTEVGFWWWVLVGVATASTIKRDLIFKGVKQNVNAE